MTLVLALVLAAGNPYLDSARAAYAKLDCDKVLADLELARKVPTNDEATTLLILDYSGRCHVALGQAAAADAAFQQMLAIDAQAELDPGLSPKIRDAFRASKLKLFPQDYVAWKELPAGPDLRRAELVDPWRKVTEVVAGRWDDAQGRFVEERLAPTGRVYVAHVKARAWFIEARSGLTSLARLGSRDVPAPLPAPVPAIAQPSPLSTVPAVEAEPQKSKGRKALNTIGGVVLATGLATAVGGVVLFSVSAANRSSAEKAEWADDARRLDGESATQSIVGHALLWPGLGVAVVGFAFSF